DRATGHKPNIGPRFPRKRPPAAKPIANTSRSGIVRGCRKTKVSKLATQVTQQLTGLRNRFERIERVCEAAQSCGRGHELSYALCTFAADRVRLEVAFLPDQAGEEIDRQIVGRRRGGERRAKGWYGRRSAQFGPVVMFRLAAFFRFTAISG